MIIPYPSFETTYRSHLEMSRIQKEAGWASFGNILGPPVSPPAQSVERLKECKTLVLVKIIVFTCHFKFMPISVAAGSKA